MIQVHGKKYMNKQEIFNPIAIKTNEWYQAEGLPKNPDGDTSLVYH